MKVLLLYAASTIGGAAVAKASWADIEIDAIGFSAVAGLMLSCVALVLIWMAKERG